MGEHFAPKFGNNAQLELGREVCAGGLRERPDEAEKDQ